MQQTRNCIRNIHVITTPRIDYLWGWVNMPNNTLGDLQMYDVVPPKGTIGNHYRIGQQTFGPATGTTSKTFVEPIQKHGLKSHVTFAPNPSGIFSNMPTSVMSGATRQALLAERDPWDFYQPHNCMKVTSQSFKGDKYIKPLYFMMDGFPKGDQYIPYNAFFKFRYRFSIDVFYKLPSWHDPAGPAANSVNNLNYRYAADFTTQRVKMFNPYNSVTAGQTFYLNSGYQTDYTPHYPMVIGSADAITQHSTLLRSARDVEDFTEDEDSPSKKIRTD